VYESVSYHPNGFQRVGLYSLVRGSGHKALTQRRGKIDRTVPLIQQHTPSYQNITAYPDILDEHTANAQFIFTQTSVSDLGHPFAIHCCHCCCCCCHCCCKLYHYPFILDEHRAIHLLTGCLTELELSEIFLLGPSHDLFSACVASVAPSVIERRCAAARRLHTGVLESSLRYSNESQLRTIMVRSTSLYIVFCSIRC